MTIAATKLFLNDTVYHKTDGRKGVVTKREYVKGRYREKIVFTITWEGGGTSEEAATNLRKTPPGTRGGMFNPKFNQRKGP